MRHAPLPTPQFYVTAPQPCPYLPGKQERKLFAALQGDAAAELNNALSHQGFRRSQNVLYRPSCADCAACLSARIVVAEFTPSKSQRRTHLRNKRLIREIVTPWATDAQYALFRRYLDSRHADGGMADMDIHEFAAMLEETPVPSRVVEYYLEDEDGRELVAVSLTDVLTDGLSMVYSFYNPDMARDSLGTYLILDHIDIARTAGLDFVYLGYWVRGSRKMGYKARFRPLEVHRGGAWSRLDPNAPDDPTPDPGANDRIAEQVAAIFLPSVKP